MTYDDCEINNLALKSFQLRQEVLDIIKHSGAGHIGGDFSVMEILVTLYYVVMNICPSNADSADRDYFILSKGHSVEAYYTVLADKGFFSKEVLKENYFAFGSMFIGHPNCCIPGIEMNTGSLGHGLSVAVGIALANQMNGFNNRTYVVMGDGELAEGSVWEGFMAAGNMGLSNLCAIIDRNGLQISGNTESVMDLRDLKSRIETFGWNVINVNGNSISELMGAFNNATNDIERPTCIIARTIKGYGGGPLIEDNYLWHHRVPSDEEYLEIMRELKIREEIYGALVK